MWLIDGLTIVSELVEDGNEEVWSSDESDEEGEGGVGDGGGAEGWGDIGRVGVREFRDVWLLNISDCIEEMSMNS